MKFRISGCVKTSLMVLAITCTVASTHATPYSAAVTNDNGTIRFILNENADNVKVVFNGGDSTNDLGALTKGSQSFNLNGATNYQIIVRKISAPGFKTGVTNGGAAPALVISSDTNATINFYAPKGVAINKNPNSPYFGRIYVANDGNGTTSTNVSRAVTSGIYVINPDQTDALGQGNTGLNGGLTLSTTTDNNPYHMAVGADDNLYICDWSDTSGNLYRVDPNVSAGSGIYALKALSASGAAVVPVGTANNHGSVAAVYVSGSTAAGNLKIYTMDEDLQANKTTTTLSQLNSLWRYDVNAAALPFGSDPTRLWTASPAAGGGDGYALASQVCQLDRGPDGKFFLTHARSNGGESGLVVRDSTGGSLTLFSSKSMSTNLGNATDYLAGAGSMSVSYDGTWVAVGRTADGKCWVIPMTNGIPDLPRRSLLTLTAVSSYITTRQIAFDPAGNLYAVNGGQESMRILSPGGTTIATYSNDTTGTNGSFNVVTIDPGISTQPVNLTNNAGTAPTFTVVASGSAALTYQWQKNGVAISGATKTSYSPSSNVQQANAGSYSVIVSNIYGNSIVSSNATLTVVDTGPVITAQTASQTANAGTSPKFTVTSYGVDPRTYQWSFNGTPISTGTTSALTLTDAQQANAGTYQCVITNALGSATSTNVTLTITDTAPIITSQTLSLTNGAGNNVSLTMTTTGTDPRYYQWQYNGTDIANATGTKYTKNNSQVVDSGTYSCLITNSLGSTPSTNIFVTITNRFAVTTAPVSKTNNAGTTVTFSVTASGNTNISYQWSFAGTPIDSATNSNYIITDVQQVNAGTYSVLVSNEVNNASYDATLTVIDTLPIITTRPVNITTNEGSTVTFSVVTTGTDPRSYQWRFNTSPVDGATNTSLVLNNVQLANAGTYTVDISNSLGTTNSATTNGILTVISSAVAPTISASVSGTSLTLLWNSTAGRNYRVQYNGDLGTTNWTALVPDISATGSTTSTNETLTTTNRYYQVILLP